MGEELLAEAITAALTQGGSWAQIGARLGFPDPCAPSGACSDLQWQNAIVDLENARAHRTHTDPNPTDRPAPGPESTDHAAYSPPLR
ncbi:hypothetical protein FXW78_21115 [Rhodococcus opacus]|nr:hypothetical protein [Rhodococcus opacus]